MLLKRSLFWRLVVGCILALNLAGCSVLYPVDPVTRLVFQDDFRDPQSGWPAQESWQGQVGYLEGRYEMKIIAPGANLSAALPAGYQFPDDVEIQVNARLLAGPQDNRFGVICRYQDPLNYYWFVISSDGYYGIGKTKAGETHLIQDAQMPPSEKISRGDQTNHFRVECVGDRLTLYINENLLGEQHDSDFSTGGIGFLVGASSQPDVQVAFEQLLVREVLK